ncbi:hypothetical protein Tco_0547375, partial [Tanacetum coccineum]
AINNDLLELEKLLRAHAEDPKNAVYRGSKLNERLKVPFLRRHNLPNRTPY